MNMSEVVIVGIKGSVLAVRKGDGSIAWQTELKSGLLLGGSGFVVVLVDGRRVYAHAHGELFCLDAYSGQILWKNELKGRGYGLATLAIEGQSSPSAAIVQEYHSQENNSNSSGSTT